MNSRFHTLKFLGLLLTVGLVSSPAIAQSVPLLGTVLATANASATILSPLSIAVSGAGMNFGNIVPSSQLGTVVLAPAGSRTASGGASTMAQAGGSVSAANFAVAGQNNASYSVALPSLAASLLPQGSAVGAPMLVTSFTSDLTATGISTIWTGALGGTGTGTFNVGATLTVGVNQGAGVYSGTFPVIIFYN
jgi:hypothetical protein